MALQVETLGWPLGFPAVALAAFVGALAVAAIILGLAMSGYAREVSTLLLAGIAISLSCSAMVLFVQYMADLTQTFRMVRWMMGGLAVVCALVVGAGSMAGGGGGEKKPKKPKGPKKKKEKKPKKPKEPKKKKEKKPKKPKKKK